MKISVITAVFNNRATIGDALESTLSQVGVDAELIVVDGGSTDGTRDVIEQYAGRIGRYISEPDGGIYDALNKGIRIATGDVVGFLHSDDFFASPHVLSRVAASFADHATGAVYGDLEYVDRQDPSRVIRTWCAGPFERRLLNAGWMPPHPTLYVRRHFYATVGPFDTTYRISADYDHVLRLFQRAELHPAYIPHVLVKMRTGGVSNRSLKTIWRKSNEDLHALRRNGVGGVGTLLSKNLSKIPQFFR